MTRRPTIIDVAHAAGVSKSTVSLVLRANPSVRAETRRKVRAAMADLGYVYNRAAANMRLADTGLIGLVINDLSNPFFAEFATALQMALAAGGYTTVIASTGEDPDVQTRVVGAMIEHGVAGLVISPAYGDTASFDAIAAAGIPAMQVLRRVDTRTGLFPFRAPDYRKGGLLATRHLLETGATRIAFVGGPEGRSVTEERMSGYCDALAEVRGEPRTLTGSATRAFGRAAAARVLDDGFDAVLCFNDLVALGLLSGLLELGETAGKRIMVVGCDDIEEAAQAHPPLSTIRCGIANFGRLAAQTLTDWLEDDTIPPPETRTPVSLVVRTSSHPT